MPVVLDWLSRHLHRSNNGKKYDPLESQCPAWESGLQKGSTTAEFSAACERIQYARQLIMKRLGALCGKLYVPGGAQDATLLEEIDEQKTLLKVILEHTTQLGLASTRGCHLDFDAKFWGEHKQLLQQIPERMWPGAPIDDPRRGEESMASLRKRDHVHIQMPIASH